MYSTLTLRITELLSVPKGQGFRFPQTRPKDYLRCQTAIDLHVGNTKTFLISGGRAIAAKGRDRATADFQDNLLRLLLGLRRSGR